MNISSSEMDLASLAARISQLEAEQHLRRKNIAWLKHYFDALKQEFQDSQSRENPTTKHESMILSQMVLQIEDVGQ